MTGLGWVDVKCHVEDPRGSLAHISDAQYGPPQPEHQGVQAAFGEGHPEAGA